MTPEESPLDVTEDGISRRRMLKRIGAGAAVVWSAPILTSIRAPALAQVTEPSPICDFPEICDPCPFRDPCLGENEACQCWMTSPDNGSRCMCLAFVESCGDTPLCPNGQSDCDQIPGPWWCVQSCCGQFCAPLCCWPDCESNMSKPRKSGAKTTR